MIDTGIREQLHSIIDHMNEDELLAASVHLASVLSRHSRPRIKEGESARLTERRRQFEASAEKHWCEANQRATGSIASGFGGGGGFGIDHRGRATGKVTYNYWDGEASVTETLLMYAGQEFEIVDRYALSADKTRIIYNQQVSCCGRVATHEAAFPMSNPVG